LVAALKLVAALNLPESCPSSLSPALVASPHCPLATCMRYDHADIGCTDAESTGVYGDVDEDDHPQASSASARFVASVSGTPRTPGRSRGRANSREDSQTRDRSSLRGRSSSHGSSRVDSPGRSRDSSPALGNDDAASSSSRVSSSRPSAYPWRDAPPSSRTPRPINPDAQKELMKRNQIILESQKLQVDKARKELAQNQLARKERMIADRSEHSPRIRLAHPLYLSTYTPPCALTISTCVCLSARVWESVRSGM
jgi:hypothetical protein